MTDKILFKEGIYHLKKYREIPKTAIEFLDSISWGNEGAVYENLKIKEHILRIFNPTLYALQDNDRIVSTAMFSNTMVSVKSKSYNCFYIKYFAASPELRGKGITTKVSKRVMELVKEEAREKSIYFASIESANKRSYNVVQNAGYREIGKIRTIGFSRFFPKAKPIEQIRGKNEKEEILSFLKDLYKNHVLVQFNSIFLKDQYYVIREKGKIVAGCQYHRGHWKINKMKGFFTKLMMRSLAYIPLLRKVFNPKKFEFLVFEGIYVEKGKEERLFELFESLL